MVFFDEYHQVGFLAGFWTHGRDCISHPSPYQPGIAPYSHLFLLSSHFSYLLEVLNEKKIVFT